MKKIRKKYFTVEKFVDNRITTEASDFGGVWCKSKQLPAALTSDV